MGKLLPMLLLVVAIQLSMVIFVGMSIPGGYIWELITVPSNWNNINIMSLLGDTIALTSIVGIALGTLLGEKGDFLVFAGVTGIFLSLGISFAELFTQLNAYEVLSFNASNIAMLITAPILVTFIYVILKFWRNSD